MCFSQTASLGFGLLGLVTGLILWARGHPARRFTIFLWFAIMEFIQYMVSTCCHYCLVMYCCSSTCVAQCMGSDAAAVAHF
jgi:hypothetical protein